MGFIVLYKSKKLTEYKANIDNNVFSYISFSLSLCLITAAILGWLRGIDSRHRFFIIII